jgi:hypothetical protein
LGCYRRIKEYSFGMKIIFTETLGTDKDTYSPIPASKFLPQWYKDLESYMNGARKPNGTGTTTATIKKCIPVFDAITAGYLILSPADVYISQKDDAPYYEWANYGLIQFHPVEQAPEHPDRNGHITYPKWTNPWAITTPKGYSCLFTAPKHRDNVFTILDGIVDTDTYSAPVNFPFVLNDTTFEGLVPAGTPIAQVIPFKRDSFELEIGDITSLEKAQNITNKLRTKFFDSYKTQFWTKKQYK